MDRIEQELEMLRARYPDVEYLPDGQWVRVPAYSMPTGWNRSSSDVAFQILISHPGTPPYGIYVPVGLKFNNEAPTNYAEPAGTQPPFDGSWGLFSWAPEDGEWRATADPATGSNLLNWVIGFAARFREGK